MRRRRQALTKALLALLFIVIVTTLGPFIAPYDYEEMLPGMRLQPPSLQHLLGTDNFGRDILSRVLVALPLSMLTGLSVAIISGVLGVAIGASGAFWPPLGRFTMRVVDALMAFPTILLALTLTAITQRAGLQNVVTALSIAYTPRMARTAYGLSLSLREGVHVEAAKALGASSLRVLIVHVVLLLLSPVLVQGTFTVALAVLGAATLDYLGVGVPPNVASLGGMISEARNYVTRAPWMMVAPGFFIFAFVLACNLLGDFLRDILDPRMVRRSEVPDAG